MFIGRDEERNKIIKFINSDKTKAGLIYGRRRVGKTELINDVLRNENNIDYLYYECKQTTEKNNVDGLTELLCEKFNLPSIRFESIEALLKYIYSLNVDKKFIIVLDEYPYLKEMIKGLDSILQTIIDNQKNKNIKLFILGSYIDVMKSLIEYDNPLYGRFELIIELKPMNYYDSCKFYPTFSNEDKVRLYSVFGGIPYYNRLIDTSLSVEENIIELIASDGARLENEINVYLKGQLSKLNNVNEVIEILSKGVYKYKDIYSLANIDKGPTLIDSLDKLVSMELVSKISPINDENNKKKTGYIIKDQLTNFYYKYIYRNQSRLKVLDSKTFYDKFIKNDFEEQYVPKEFENIVKEYLIMKNKSNLLNEPFYKIGKYYYDDKKTKTNGEFDVVTYDEKGYIFYEAKFKNKALSRQDVDNEIEQVKKTGLNAYKYGFVSKSGFLFNDDSLILLTLDDLYQ